MAQLPVYVFGEQRVVRTLPREIRRGRPFIEPNHHRQQASRVAGLDALAQVASLRAGEP